jgi:hypothetical protein
MNLLKVQDALKNASDQQLMALMQAPDSTAPSYLVLSEIRRRKDMRSKQAPEGQSNRTVAEELTAPEAPAGIRGLQPQMDPDGVDAAEGGDVQGMAAGGIVRMQAGGGIDTMSADQLRQLLAQMSDPRFAPTGLTASPDEIRRRIADIEQREEDRFLQAPRSRLRQDIGAVGQAIHGAAGATGGVLSEAGRLAADVGRAGAEYAFTPVEARSPFPEGRFPEPEPVRGRFLREDRVPDRDEVRGPDLASLMPPAPAAARTGTQGQAQAGRPTTAQAAAPQGAPGGGAPGIEGLRNAPTGIPEGGQLPTMADLMRQNAALFPDGLGSIRDRMREERVDPAARRSEAVNMALIEAGLRIAGSRNPSLIGAIGEGALPAVQSYSQQLGQIRGEQRQARQDELELAKQDTNRQFAIGQISAAEYRSRMDNINANLRANAQERGANARLAASEAAAERRAAAAATAAEQADLRRGYASPERLARMTPEERAAFERIRTIGRPLDTSGASAALNSTLQDINRIATQIDTLGPRPTRNFADWDRNNASLQQRLRDAEARRRQLEDIVVYGRPRDGAGGSTNLPSGGRIENGRYIPAGS